MVSLKISDELSSRIDLAMAIHASASAFLGYRNVRGMLS